MMDTNSKGDVSSDSIFTPAPGLQAQGVLEQRYRVEYVDPVDPSRNWVDEFENLVPDASLNKWLDDSFVTKTPHANFYVGLITGPGASGVAAGDTAASHAGWSESTAYSNATRPAWSPGAVASKSCSNTASPAVFNINATATIGGCFLVSSSDTAGGTKSGTGGTLRGCGAFSSGDKSVSSGGTLTVTVTASAS